MITITDVHKIFNKGKANQVNAINGITLEIRDAEFLVVVGSNGSGKTTLLNLIAGSVLPDKGTLNIDSVNVTKMPDYKRSQWIARVFQNPLSGTAPDLSILDNFRLASLRTSKKGLSVGVNDAFKKQVKEKVASLGMDLQDKIDQPMGTLSGGQRQALTLLMSVMDSCKVLLLDEPTAALDPRSAEVVMRTADTLIHEFKLTAVFITHNLKDAFNYGTRIIQMGEGLIINDLSGTEKTSLKQNDLFDWFA
jgi:putative ABC transport system ATP-binding protein